MHDTATAKIWQSAFSKHFGRMVQGDDKTGQKGTNSIFVMTYEEISLIPKIIKSLMLMSLPISAHKNQIHIEFRSPPAALDKVPG